MLLPGETGSGKSALIWSIIYQLAPAIADGTVELWGIDPKAMELAAGEPLFARMAYTSPADYADTLEDAVVVMRRPADPVARGHPAAPTLPGRAADRDLDRRAGRAVAM